jgi:hypothetical protein
VWKWLRQQSKDFFGAGFDALGKRWNKCITVGGRYVEKYFFQVRISRVLRFVSICDLFTDFSFYYDILYPGDETRGSAIPIYSRVVTF